MKGFIEGLRPRQRSDWMRDMAHTSRNFFPKISNLEYTINPYNAKEFNSGAEAHLFAVYIKSFFPDGYLGDVVAEKREEIALREDDDADLREAS